MQPISLSSLMTLPGSQQCLLLRNGWAKNTFTHVLRNRGITVDICCVFIMFQDNMPSVLHELLK